MKNFSLKTKASYRRNSKYSKLWGITGSILGALLVLYVFGGLLGKYSFVLSQPIYTARNWMVESSATIPSYFRDRKELIQEISDLQREVARFSEQNATVSRLIHENNELLSLMNVNDTERIAAAVTARPPFLPYDSLLIDRGEREGIKEGAIVYYAHDQAIGFVSRVYSESALVTLFSTPGVETTVYIYGPNIYTTAYGEGGGIVRISVPQGISVVLGDVVIIPSIEIGVLGTLKEIKSVSTQPEQHGYVMSEAPIQTLNLVSVSSRVLQKRTFEEVESIVAEYNYEALKVAIPDDTIVGGSSGSSTGTTTPRTEEVTHE